MSYNFKKPGDGEVGCGKYPTKWPSRFPVGIPKIEQAFIQDFSLAISIGVSTLRWTIEKKISDSKYIVQFDKRNGFSIKIKVETYQHRR